MSQIEVIEEDTNNLSLNDEPLLFAEGQTFTDFETLINVSILYYIF